jgi:hypothetical protein
VSRVLPSVLSLAIGLLPIAAPEHVHEREESGHGELLVHRHVPSHGILPHDSASVDHAGDEPILTLTALYTVPGPFALAGPERMARTLIEPPRPHVSVHVRTTFDVSIHGPPRAPTALRAPPITPAT